MPSSRRHENVSGRKLLPCCLPFSLLHFGMGLGRAAAKEKLSSGKAGHFGRKRHAGMA